jgi:hypothetical protein
MKRWGILAALVIGCPGVVFAATAFAHDFDHPLPGFSEQAPLSSTVNSGGEGAEWELVATIPTGNPHSDLDYFTHNGDIYASVGTLAAGANAGGQTIIQLTDEGQVDPAYVAAHPSASCVTTTSSVTGLQHDAEASPKGGTLLTPPNDFADQREAQIVVDATDATGRCHDEGVLGQQAPQGGLEIIDVTEGPNRPKEIGLTVHVGQSHTVNVDPKRPHIAYSVTSDFVPVGDDGKRTNETSGNLMDGFEVVDMSSCMNFPPGTTIQQKRDACRPEVYRYRYPDINIAVSSRYPNRTGACHEVEIYPDDSLLCASLTATAIFDMKGAFDDRGTPNDFSDDKPRGTPLPCRVRPTTTVAPIYRTGAMVTDCHMGEQNGLAQPLTVSEWLKIGAPSLEGVVHKGTVHHMGFEDQQRNSVAPAYDSTRDIFVSHEAEFSQSGKYVFATDERGGGVLPGGATCSPGADNRIGNGGVHAFPVDKFVTGPSPTPEEIQENSYAKTSNGERAIFRAPTRTGPQASVCTSHLMQQIPGQNRIFMAWYSQATQVIDFTENPDGTLDFKQAGWFIPEGANEWVSAIFKAQENRDGTFTYWGATGDFALTGTGRNAIDVYKVTLPPAQVAGRGPQFPVASACTAEANTSFDRLSAGTTRSGIRFGFSRRGPGGVRVKLFRKVVGRNIHRRARLIRDFGTRSRGFVWRGRARGVRDGYYIATFAARSPNGRRDVRSVALRRDAGRFFQLRPFQRKNPCGIVSNARLISPFFGGRSRSPLTLAFRLRETANVRVIVRRGRRVVRRYKSRSFAAGRTHRRRLGIPRGRSGEYTVVLRVSSPGHGSSVSLTGRKFR